MTISKNPHKIREMFNNIAEKYDFNNNIISLGTHRFIKYLSVKHLDISGGAKILDECCGTGDFAKFILKRNADCDVTGVDFSKNMLKIAEKKVPQAKFIQADCTDLPFEDKVFDIITMGFGLRNIEDYEKAIKESYRVLKHGGQFLHVDFGEKNFFSKIFDIIVPPVINIFYGKKLPYKYLVESKREFFTPEKLIKTFEQHNFRLKTRKDYLFGVISAQIFEKTN